PGRPAVYLGQRDHLNDLRLELAAFIGAKPEQLAIVRNVTEAIALIAVSFPFTDGDVVLLSDQEHPANLFVWRGLEQAGRIKVRLMSPGKTGQDTVAALRLALAEGPVRLFGISHVLAATGRVLPVAELSAIAHRAGAAVLVDGAQAPGAIPVDVMATGADFYALNGHKWMLAPVGCGALTICDDWRPRLLPIPMGAGSATSDEDGRFTPLTFLATASRYETGTHNGSLAVGFREAVRLQCELGPSALFARSAGLRDRFLAGIQRLDTVTVVDGEQNGTMVSVRIDGWPVDQVVAELWQRHQVTVRMVHELRPFAVRFSFAAFNTEEEVDLAVFAVGELAEAQRRP
ncbi:MAG: aminotransferase class V-fold PLP-dependent enzyme, partial [Sulfobacillus sp.]